MKERPTPVVARITGAPSALRGALIASLAVAGVFVACSVQENYLGFDTPLRVEAGPALPVIDAGQRPRPGTGGQRPGVGEVEQEAGIADDDLGATDDVTLPVVEAGSTPTSTSTSTSSSDEPILPEDVSDASVPDMPSEPSAFEVVLDVPPEQVRARVMLAYEALFHGDPDTQSIYYELDDERAYVFDVLHDDTRLDALGYGMMITVQLDRRDEFDKLWRFTKETFQYAEGPYEGYFRMICQPSGEDCDEGAGVFGALYVTTALLFAESRWGNADGIFDYGAQARDLLDVMLNKEERSGGVVEGVTNLFDRDAALPKSAPEEEMDGQVTVGSVVPAFFQVWADATGEPFWAEAAERGRDFLQQTAHEETGLAPARADFDGVPLEEHLVFNESSYPIGLAIALDHLWYGVEAGQVELADRLITFFATYPRKPYPSIFATDGTALNEIPSGALVALNGATCAIATVPACEQMIRTIWETPMPQGLYRFFDGINHMQALLILGGYFRVH